MDEITLFVFKSILTEYQGKKLSRLLLALTRDAEGLTKKVETLVELRMATVAGSTIAIININSTVAATKIVKRLKQRFAKKLPQ